MRFLLRSKILELERDPLFILLSIIPFTYSCLGHFVLKSNTAGLKIGSLCEATLQFSFGVASAFHSV